MTSKTAYQFDRAGMLTGTTEADESPLEPGVYLLPANCTLVAPPEEWPADKWPRWMGRNWKLAIKPVSHAESGIDPVAKLRDFLNNNPDVAALMDQ
ncbi:hypothetical protein [Perlucidibaca piscinae]|uniref:hypothetical protein n=1 Tax=Perlucidibaca piscinae TaxID=392589 RepID=UPI0003B54DAF|nr:hypothetical protein [Perlucidibaca piscinae]